MRFATSILVVAALLSLTSGVPLQACPLLKQSSKHSCCHTKPPYQCPIPSLSDCPLLNKQTSLAPALDNIPLPLRVAIYHVPAPRPVVIDTANWSPTHRDLLILLRVLRI
jgi:hypothetical protein